MGRKSLIIPPVFVSHGGGPLPLLGDTGHEQMVVNLVELAATLPRPKAIVVFSAHWETSVATVTSGLAPELIYDYYGFAPESYQITYPAAGSPELAARIAALLHADAQAVALDNNRGFDHGLFVPLKLMYPDADIPCVQLSLNSNLNPAQHIAMGRALAPLKDEGVLLLGSGLTFHNLAAFFAEPTLQSDAANNAFESWLGETCCNLNCTETEREQRLLHWAQAPHARYCHPREEHLLPLLVCYGAAATAASKYHKFSIMNKSVGSVIW